MAELQIDSRTKLYRIEPYPQGKRLIVSLGTSDLKEDPDSNWTNWKTSPSCGYRSWHSVTGEVSVVVIELTFHRGSAMETVASLADEGSFEGVVRFDESKLRGHVDQVVRTSVEGDAERSARSGGRQAVQREAIQRVHAVELLINPIRDRRSKPAVSKRVDQHRWTKH